MDSIGNERGCSTFLIVVDTSSWRERKNCGLGLEFGNGRARVPFPIPLIVTGDRIGSNGGELETKRFQLSKKS
jgi:hypothetical protein